MSVCPTVSELRFYGCYQGYSQGRGGSRPSNFNISFYKKKHFFMRAIFLKLWCPPQNNHKPSLDLDSVSRQIYYTFKRQEASIGPFRKGFREGYLYLIRRNRPWKKFESPSKKCFPS